MEYPRGQMTQTNGCTNVSPAFGAKATQNTKVAIGTAVCWISLMTALMPVGL